MVAYEGEEAGRRGVKLYEEGGVAEHQGVRAADVGCDGAEGGGGHQVPPSAVCNPY